MGDLPETIQHEILAEYERSNGVRASGWLQRYPEHRVAIEAFIHALTDELDMSDDSSDAWLDSGGAVSAWMEARSIQRARARAERSLARRRALILTDGVLPPLTRRPPRPPLDASVPGRVGGAAGWVNRVRVVKSLDLVRRYFDLPFYHFVPAQAGPLDERIYEDEGVAKSRRWIELESPRASAIRVGPNVAAAEQEALPYIRDVELADDFLRHIASVDQWELAVWTTVNWTADKLAARGEGVSVESIKAGIIEETAWGGKLDWANFSDLHIQSALEHLTRLSLIQEEE